MQVRVAEQDDRVPSRPLTSASQRTVAGIGLAVAVPVALWVLLPASSLVDIPVLLAVFLGLVAAESFSVHFEFRKQALTWTPSELAFMLALATVGGAWTAGARAAAVAVVLLVQGYPRPKAAFNVSVGVLEVCAAVAVLDVLPAGDISTPTTWVSYLVAVIGASVLGAALIAAAITLTQGYPGRTLWTTLFVPVLMVGPVSVVVGLAVLLLVSVTPWAWLLISPLLVALALLYRQFGAVTRKGHSVERVYDFARRVEQVSPDEDGTRQIVQAVRELLNADRVALWLPPYPDEGPRVGAAAGGRGGERRRLVRRPRRSRRRLPPPGREFRRRPGPGVPRPRGRAGGGRAAPPWGLRPARRRGDDRGRRAGLSRGLRPAQRRHLLRRQRPRRPRLDADSRQRGNPPPAAAHPDPLRRRPRPADRPAQPAAPARRDRPAALRRPGPRAGRADPRGPRQLHRGH